MTEPLLIPAKQVGPELSIGRDRVYALIKTGRLKSISIGSRLYVPRSELAAFVERELMNGAKPP
jgi:excisionase family DNA binding protein